MPLHSVYRISSEKPRLFLEGGGSNIYRTINVIFYGEQVATIELTGWLLVPQKGFFEILEVKLLATADECECLQEEETPGAKQSKLSFL